MAMRIRLRKVWGAVILGLGFVNLVLAVLARYRIGVAMGALFILVGVLYLTGAFLVVEEGRLLVKNALGMTVRTYPFESLRDFVIEGGRVYLQRGGERVPRRGWSSLMADPNDWAKFLEAIRRAGGGGTG
jgi:hypothetical protein